MTMHPDTLDRIVPASPWEAVRERYATLAHDDRPGDPYDVPVVSYGMRRAVIVVMAIQFIACASVVGLAWMVLS